MTTGDAFYMPQSLLLATGGAYLIVGEGKATGSGVIIVDLTNCEHCDCCTVYRTVMAGIDGALLVPQMLQGD